MKTKFSMLTVALLGTVVCVSEARARVCPSPVDYKGQLTTAFLTAQLRGYQPPNARQMLVFSSAPAGDPAVGLVNVTILLRDEGFAGLIDVPAGQSALVLPGAPLVPGDRAAYEAVIREWNESLIRMTQGVHRLGSVHVYYDRTPGFLDEAKRPEHVLWHRWYVRNSRAFDWHVTNNPNSETLNAPTMVGYEEPVSCASVDFEFERTVACSSQAPCTEDGFFCLEDGFCGRPRRVGQGICVGVLDGLTCVDDSAEGEVCVDDDGLVFLHSEYLGNVLAHESGHLLYSMRDEYDRDLGGPWVCLGELSPGEEPRTSIMAQVGRTHVCDETTHVAVRELDGETICNEHRNIPSWDIMATGVPQLAGGHPQLGEFPELPDLGTYPDPEIVWHDEPQNDMLILVDRSGSMGSTANSATGLNAYENARDAAIGLYNDTSVDSVSVGVYLYNHQVEPDVVPYAPRSAEIDRGTFDGIDPIGSTDICRVITAGAEAVREEHADAPYGNLVLMSDGKPTVSGCDENQDVLQAAIDACGNNRDPSVTPNVRIYALSFGDANEELMRQVALVCDASNYSMSARGTPSQLASEPEELKFELARLTYEARGYAEVHEQRRLLEEVQAQSFPVPVGTQELEVAWLGDGFDFINVGDGLTDCSFRTIDFELVSPSGQVVPARPLSQTRESERDPQFVKIRQVDPQPGSWTMRTALRSEYTCRNASGEVGKDGYRPKALWLAQIKNLDVDAGAHATPSSTARNRSVRVEASFASALPYRLAGLEVVAKLRKEGSTSPFPMSDDGTSGDRIAGDGIYTGVFNDDQVVRPEGYYEVEVDLATVAGQTHSVPTNDVDADLGLGDAPGGAIDFGGLRLKARTSFTLSECCDPDVGGVPFGCDACADPRDCAVADFGALETGTSYTDLRILTSGFPTAASGVQVGLGPEIRVSNVRATYDTASDSGVVLFDADVPPGALRGGHTLQVVFGADRCIGHEDAFDVCASGELPEITVEDVTHVQCLDRNAAIDLTAAVATDACGDAGNVVVDAWIATVNGTPVNPVVPVDPADPQVVLPVGTSEVVWRAVDQTTQATRTVTQTVVVEAGVTAAACCQPFQTTIMLTSDPNLYAHAADPAPVCVFGLGGSDLIMTGSAMNFASGGSGTDSVSCGNGGSVLVGEGDSDTLTGGAGADVLDGGSGNDVLGGNGGNDFLLGGPGAEVLNGGDGADVLWGGAGDDVLHGGSGADDLYAGSGLTASDAGAGNDRLFVLDACELVSGKVFEGGSGTDTLFLPAGVTLAQLQAAGVVVASDIESVQTLPSPRNIESDCF